MQIHKNGYFTWSVTQLRRIEEQSIMINLALRSGAKMPVLGFGTFIGGKNAPDAYKDNFQLSSFH